MNWKQLTLTIHDENRMSRIPVTFTKTWKVEVWKDMGSEDEEEYKKLISVTLISITLLKKN